MQAMTEMLNGRTPTHLSWFLSASDHEEPGYCSAELAANNTRIDRGHLPASLACPTLEPAFFELGLAL